jgi:hypothetical protein
MMEKGQNGVRRESATREGRKERKNARLEVSGVRLGEESHSTTFLSSTTSATYRDGKHRQNRTEEC